MVKLRVAVRVIPEDGYLASIKSAEAGMIEGEKKFAVIVRDPGEWYIGTLALEIQESYKRRYKYDLGKIKYLKAEDDCDLDPEDLVTDQLLDEGKAAKDGTDQSVTVKVIQEQGRALRAGSVVPDLTPVHYKKPLEKPPVPLFSSTTSSLGKRDSAQRNSYVNGDHAKRMRMDEITEMDEDDTIVNSIEDNDNRQSPEMMVQDSQSTRQSPHGVRSAEKSNGIVSPELGAAAVRASTGTTNDNLSSEPAAKKRGRPKKTSPTEGEAAQSKKAKTPEKKSNAKAVNKLNGMSPILPNLQRSSSSAASAKKFQKQPRDLHADADSDIDDSQMSPRSRGATNKKTPSSKTVAGLQASRGANDKANDKPSQEHASPITSKKRKRRGEVNASNASPANPQAVEKRQAQGRTSAKAGNTKKKHATEKAVQERGGSSSDVDSPGAQLSQGLQYFEPTPPRDQQSANEPAENPTLFTTTAAEAKNGKSTKLAVEPLEKKKAGRRKSATPPTKLKCFGCWQAGRVCDNARPKCTACEKRKVNCQEYAIKEEDYDRIKTERRAGKKKKAAETNSPIRVSPKATKESAESLAPKPSTNHTTEPQTIVVEVEDAELLDLLPDLETESKDKDKLSVPENKQGARSSSADSQTQKMVVLPPGMSPEQYAEIVQSRAGITDEERTKQNKALQKKNSTNALRKTSSRESEAHSVEPQDNQKLEAAAKPAKPSPQVETKPSAVKKNQKAASTTPARTPSVVPPVEEEDKPDQRSSVKATPSEVQSKSAAKTTPATTAPKKSATPTSATPANKNKNNPPFKRPEPKSSKPAGPIPLSQSRNLGELTARLSAQSSAANSPRPSINLGKNLSKDKAKHTSFLDKSDDSDSSTESESESESGSETSSKKTKKNATPQAKAKQATPVRAKDAKPSENTKNNPAAAAATTAATTRPDSAFQLSKLESSSSSSSGSGAEDEDSDESTESASD